MKLSERIKNVLTALGSATLIAGGLSIFAKRAMKLQEQKTAKDISRAYTGAIERAYPGQSDEMIDKINEQL